MWLFTHLRLTCFILPIRPGKLEDATAIGDTKLTAGCKAMLIGNPIGAILQATKAPTGAESVKLLDDLAPDAAEKAPEEPLCTQKVPPTPSFLVIPPPPSSQPLSVNYQARLHAVSVLTPATSCRFSRMTST